MPRFAANLTMLYPQHAFLDRFAAAAADGFKAVEFMSPFEHRAVDIKAQLDAHGLALALFNAPAGNTALGERGLTSLPGREADFRTGFATALEYAAVLGNDRVHVMAGVMPANADPAQYRDTYLANLAYACEQAATAGITVLIEPINPRDIPGYFLNRQDVAQGIRAEVGASNLKVQFDCYHCQIVEGDIATKLRRDMPNIGHIQIAGAPDRQEPDRGEINYPYLFELIDQLGYKGWIGCEYRPRGDTSNGLGWARGLL